MTDPSPAFRIEPAGPSDILKLIEIDKAASRLFEPTGLLSAEALADHVPAEAFEWAMRHELLDVARLHDGAPVGFTLVSGRGAGLYLDQISVDPAHGKKGIGRALMKHVIQKAHESGLPEVTLSTFRDLPWNGPFYASLGFSPLPRKDMEPFMHEIESLQARSMDVTQRIFMRKRVRRHAFRVRRQA